MHKHKSTVEDVLDLVTPLIRDKFVKTVTKKLHNCIFFSATIDFDDPFNLGYGVFKTGYENKEMLLEKIEDWCKRFNGYIKPELYIDQLWNARDNRESIQIFFVFCIKDKGFIAGVQRSPIAEIRGKTFQW